jgi:hypothetical protein
MEGPASKPALLFLGMITAGDVMSDQPGLLARIKPIAKAAAVIMLVAVVGAFALYCVASAVWLNSHGD